MESSTVRANRRPVSAGPALEEDLKRKWMGLGSCRSIWASPSFEQASLESRHYPSGLDTGEVCLILLAPACAATL